MIALRFRIELEIWLLRNGRKFVGMMPLSSNVTGPLQPYQVAHFRLVITLI
jgi:hypothetical protein